MAHTRDHKEEEDNPFKPQNLYTADEIENLGGSTALEYWQTREGIATGTDEPSGLHFVGTGIPSGKREWAFFAADLGLKDSIRGVKQMAGWDLEDMQKQQQILNMGMQDPELRAIVMGAYMAGLIGDPAGWVLPAAKGKNVASMLKWLIPSGAFTGFTGYVDPEAKSLVRGLMFGDDVPMSRTEQTLIGAGGAGALGPLMHLLGKTGSATYAKASPILKKAVRIPEVATGLAGAAVGRWYDEEGEWKGTVTGLFSGMALARGTKFIPAGSGEIGRAGSRKWFGQMFIDNFGLPEGYVAYKHGRKMTKAEIAEDFGQLADDISKLTPNEGKALYRMLQGEEDVTDILRPLHDQARATLTRHGQTLVNLGVLDADTFAENIGTYIHRTYRNKIKKYGIGSNPEGVRVIGDELKIRGASLKVGAGELAAKKADGWEVVRKLDDGNFIIRMDLTPDMRKALGEVEDAHFALSRTGQLLSNDIATYKLFDDVAGDLKLSSLGPNPELGHTKMIPDRLIEDAAGDAKVYGSLSGRYVDENIYNDLVHFTKWRHVANNNKVTGPYLNLLRKWKITKTALNPAVHANNFLSNIMLFDLKGGKARWLSASARALMGGRKNELFKEAQKAGLFDSDYAARELRMEERTAYSNYLTVTGKMEDAPQNAMQLAGRLSMRAAKWVPNQLINLYQAEDRVFRLALYKTLREKGMDPAEAARIARRDMIDYDINAPGINLMRQTGWPFLAYSYRVYPLLVDAAIEHPVKFAKWAALFYGLNKIGEAAGGKEQVAAEKQAMPEDFQAPMFGLKGMPSTVTRLPVTSTGAEAGLNRIKQALTAPLRWAGIQEEFTPVRSIGDFPLFVDWARKIPGGNFMQLGAKYGPDIKGVPEVLQPSLSVIGATVLPLFGIDPFTLKQYPGWDADNRMSGDNLKAMLDMYLEAWTPNFPGFPGAYSTRKIAQADKEAYTEFQTPLPPWLARLQTFGGTVRRGDVYTLQKRKDLDALRVKNEILEKGKQLESEYRKQRISEEQYMREREKLEEQIAVYERRYAEGFGR